MTASPTSTVGGALAAPYVDGLRQGRVRFQRCAQCQAAQTLARHACTRCGSETLRWQEASGLATVRAVTVISRAPSEAFRPLVPYTVVIVELDEGARLMGHAQAGTAIGSRVRATTFEWNGNPLLRFVPSLQTISADAPITDTALPTGAA